MCCLPSRFLKCVVWSVVGGFAVGLAGNAAQVVAAATKEGPLN